MTSSLTRRLFSPSQIYTRYGKCYTFNSGLDGNPLLTTLKGGTGNGLEIMLDIQQDEYLPVWGETGQCVSAAPSVPSSGCSFRLPLHFTVYYLQNVHKHSVISPSVQVCD